MPVPVFVRLSYLRYTRGISIAEAARQLGIAASYLFDLEEFIKTPNLNMDTKSTDGKFLPFIYRIKEFAESLSTDSKSSLAFSSSDLQNMNELLNNDIFFHSIMPTISNVYVDLPITSEDKKNRHWQPSYQLFYTWFINNVILSPENNIDDDKYTVCAPCDNMAAEAIHYLFTRAYTRGARRRKDVQIFKGTYTPFSQDAEPSSQLGTLYIDHRKPSQGILYSSVEAYPKRNPIFVYLLLYICIKKLQINLSPSKYWPIPWPNKLDFTDDIENAPPSKDALVLATPFGEITVFFRSLLTPSSEFYFVSGDALPLITR